MYKRKNKYYKKTENLASYGSMIYLKDLGRRNENIHKTKTYLEFFEGIIAIINFRKCYYFKSISSIYCMSSDHRLDISR